MAPSDVSSAMVAGLVDVEQSRLSTLGCQARTILDFFDGHECEFLSSWGTFIDTWPLKRSRGWTQLHSDVPAECLEGAVVIGIGMLTGTGTRVVP